ncbi:MAG TPA: conjugative transposon protein TraK [Puia sp.]|nr:conjugative transposon protein TraK [Puia sp.]
MFKKAQAIDTAFQMIRSFCIAVIILCALISCFVLYSSHRMVNEAQARIYILANGKALEAYGADRKDNIPVEARDHIKTFHQDFFTLDPDEKVITTNITRALYLADRSAKKQYDNLKESGYYTNLITANISQQIEVDSIEINTDAYPFHFRFTGHEKLIRSTSIVTRSLVTEGWLRNVSRSDNDPHGFLIEKWMILENKDIKTELR